ncbi:MAG: hypothetical protein JO301_03250 [Chitinophagaceae bacterium]|nr:hypothetical protein [Chitinophagaceae bacterium]
MRNFTLLACAFLFSISVHAQFSAGNKLIGGNLYFTGANNSSSASPGTEQQTSFAAFDLSLMRFRTPASLAGFGLSAGYSRYRTTDGTIPFDTYSSGYNFGAFFNWTRLEPLASRFYMALTGSVNAQYNFGQIDNSSSVQYTHYNGYSTAVAGALGVWYSMHPRLLFTCDLNNLITLAYSHNVHDSYSGATLVTAKQSSFTFRSGLGGFSLNNLSVGIRYLLK